MKDDEKQPATKDRVTLLRIAETLGVSRTTVSNAYNRPERLSSALKAQVFDTAKQLGYAGPDPAARGLRRGRTNAVGIIYDSPLSYAFDDAAAVAFLQGVSSVAEEEKLGLLLVPGSFGETRNAAAIGNAIVDGFVVYSVSEDDPLIKAALERGSALVIVDQPYTEGVPFISVDDKSAARTAAEHLLNLGHQYFGVVCFGLRRDGTKGFADLERQRSALYQVSRARLEGYAEALLEAGISWSEVPVFECQGSSQNLGREAAQAIFARPTRPTAILATSDRLALGVLETAKEAGLSVPRDVSVVGFDNTLEAARSDPPLTTVAQNQLEKGRLAGQLLIARLRGNQPVNPEPMKTWLIVRGSSGPLGGR